jgi:nicotinamidase-related amidase
MASTDNFKPVLIVVDVQFDFVRGSLAVPEAESIIDGINSLLDSNLPFIKKIATKDYHPPDHISFATTHGKPLLSTTTIYPPGQEKDESKALEQVLWPVHCVASTPGADFLEELHSGAFDAVVYKGTNREIESYSAFHDPWKITTTELPQLLSANGVTDVFMCGLAGDYCVKCTALDAVDYGYKTWIIRDAVKSVSKSGAEWTEMEERGVKMTSIAEVTDMIRNRARGEREDDPKEATTDVIRRWQC